MDCDLNNIWTKAYEDVSTYHMIDAFNKSECLIYKGYKIEKKDDVIQVLKPLGEYYTEISIDDYNQLCSSGWKQGVLKLVLRDCEELLDEITNRIRLNTNINTSEKEINKLKKNREIVMNQYHKLAKQINNN